MKGRPARSLLIAICTLASINCAVHQTRSVRSSPFVQGSPGEAAPGVAGVESPPARISPVRQRTELPRIEDTDPRLKGALERLAEAPSPEAHLAVAAEYRKLKIHDFAIDHATKALVFAPRTSAAFDLRARSWRDVGLIGLALGDASRGVYFAPESAAAHNTLGTVLLLLGRLQLARSEFEAVMRLDPRSAYGLSNLCRVDLLEGGRDAAREHCVDALRLDPDLSAARLNLAMIGTETRSPTVSGQPGGRSGSRH